MYNVQIVIGNSSDREIINFVEFKKDVCLTIYDITSKKDKSAAYKLKSHWGAHKNPFVVITKGDSTIKVFYSENGNAIDKLILWAATDD